MSPFQRYSIVREVLGRELAKDYGYGFGETVSDCFFTGCAVADALDPSLALVATYRGRYRNLAGANRALLRAGFKGLPSLFEHHLRPAAPAGCIVGDIAVLQLHDGAHVGVFDGRGVVTKTRLGRSNHAIGEAIAAFRVAR